MIRNLILPVWLLCCIAAMPIMAQSDGIPQVTDKYILTNANVTTAPGKTFAKANILIEDGMIKQVGANVAVPYDAIEVKADSMYIYPGFISGLSQAGVPKPEEKKKDGKEKPNYLDPDKTLVGITPQITIADVYSAKDKGISDLRSTGFTAVHSVPRGLMLPGSGSVILLSGKEKNDVLVKENVSTFGQFKGAKNRVFPSTLIGVMSKLRDLHHEAADAKKYEAKYAMSPAGMKKPNYDEATKALYPWVSKSVPLYFRTEKALDAYRIMSIQRELGFNLVLSGLKQTDQITPKLNSATSVLLSLDLPKKTEEKDDKKKKKDADKDSDPEKDMLAKRTKESKAKYEMQAANLAKSGKSFAFSTVDMKSKDILPNIRRMIAAGLSEDKALAALTTNPAKMLNISNVAGTIENGKLANLVVATKPIFDEKSKIKYVFVAGQQFEMEIKEKKKKTGDGDAIDDLSGNYEYEIEIPGMTRSGKLKLKKTGDSYTVMISQEEDPDDFEEIPDVEPDGNSITFDFSVDNDGFTMNVAMDLDFEDSGFEGQVSVGDFGSFPVTGTKNPE